MKNKFVKIIKQVLPWAVTIILLCLVLKGISFNQLRETFVQTNWQILFGAVLSSLIFTLYICVYKYKAILKYLGYDIRFADVQMLKLGILPAKTFIPFKAGEFLRAVYLKEKFSVPYSQGIYSIVLGYLLRIVVLGIFVGVTKLFGGTFLAIIAGLISLVVVSVLFRDFWLVFYSFWFEVFLLINYFIVFLAVGINISPGNFLSSVCMVLFMESLPISVYGVGIREGLLVTFLAGKFARDKLLVAGLLGSFFNGFVPLLVGLFFVPAVVNKIIRRKENEHVVVPSV